MATTYGRYIQRNEAAESRDVENQIASVKRDIESVQAELEGLLASGASESNASVQYYRKELQSLSSRLSALQEQEAHLGGRQWKKEQKQAYTAGGTKSYERSFGRIIRQQQRKALDEEEAKVNADLEAYEKRMNEAIAACGGDAERIAEVEQEYQKGYVELANRKSSIETKRRQLDEADRKDRGETVSGGEREGGNLGAQVAGSFANAYNRAAYNGAMRSGRDPSGVSASDRRIADLREQNAQHLDAAAQQNYQIANRDYMKEADKEAFAKTATHNQQIVNNLRNASGGAAALEREVLDADYEGWRARQDEQRAQAVQYLDAADAARQGAEESRAQGKRRDYRWGDLDATNARTWYATYPPTGRTREPPIGGGGVVGGGGGVQRQGRVVVEQQTPAPDFIPQNVINYYTGSPVRRLGGDDETLYYTSKNPDVTGPLDQKAPQVLRFWLKERSGRTDWPESIFAPIDGNKGDGGANPDDAKTWEAAYIKVVNDRAAAAGIEGNPGKAWMDWLRAGRNPDNPNENFRENSFDPALSNEQRQEGGGETVRREFEKVYDADGTFLGYKDLATGDVLSSLPQDGVVVEESNEETRTEGGSADNSGVAQAILDVSGYPTYGLA